MRGSVRPSAGAPPGLPRALAAAIALLITACGGAGVNEDEQAPNDQTTQAAPSETTPGAGETSPADSGPSPVASAPTSTVTSPSTSYERVSVEMAIQEGSGSNLPAVVAREQGFFDDYGLDVTFTPLAGPALLSAIVAGEVQFFNQAVQLVGQAIQEDVQLRFFCGNYPTNWSVIIGRADAGHITTADGASWQEVIRSLEGTRLGLTNLGATQEHWITAIMQAADMSPDSITFIPVGVGAQGIAAIEADQVDTILGYSFVKQQLVATGEYVELFTFDETGEEVLGSQMNTGWIADAAWLDANPEVAERLCMALGDAMEWFKDRANEAELHEILAGDDFGIDDPAVRDVITEPGGILGQFTTEIECDRLERAGNFFVEFGEFDPEPPINCETAVWSP